MFAMITSWIRSSVKAAFLGGIEDALNDLGARRENGAVEIPEEVLAGLQARFTLAPVEPEASPTATGRRSRASA